jgi:hypothetical protein
VGNNSDANLALKLTAKIIKSQRDKLSAVKREVLGNERGLKALFDAEVKGDQAGNPTSGQKCSMMPVAPT